MNTLTVDDGIVSTLIEIATNENKTLDQLFDDWIEEYLDKKAAERAEVILEQIRTGKMETISWEQAKRELHEMDS